MKVLIAVFISVFAFIAQAGEVVFEFNGTDPQLKRNFMDANQPIDTYKALSNKIENKSFTQEFDIEFINVGRRGFFFIGNDSFKLFFCRGTSNPGAAGHFGKTIRIYDKKLGYIAKKDLLEYKSGNVYHVKMIYNHQDSNVQAIVTIKKSGVVLWDSGKQMCSPATVSKIVISVRGQKGKTTAPFSEVTWDKQRNKLKLASDTYSNYRFEAYIANMKLTVN